MEPLGGVPAEWLTTAELAGVWSGWSSMRDREVVRESSAKGTHIQLAHKFLRHRKNVNLEDAQLFFNNEVDIWIDELLNKQQIHRASHILRNVGRDPIAYIRKICIKLPDSKIRDYLVNHVVNSNGFSNDDILAWDVIQCLKKYKDKCKFADKIFYNKLIPNICIQDVLNLDDHLKDSLITELYFITLESSLSSKLKTEIVWHYLLLNNKIDFLINWIDVYYNKRENINSHSENIDSEIFSTLNITSDMIESIDTSDVTVHGKLILLNHLARYGVFLKKEQEDIKLTLSRLFSASIIPSEFNKILSKEHCRVNVNAFYQNVFSIVYHQKIVDDDFDYDVHLQEKKLLHLLRDISKSSNIDQKHIINAIFQTINNVTNDFSGYLQSNPYLALTLIIIKYQTDCYLMQQQDGNNKLINFKDYIRSYDVVFEDLTIKKEVIDEILKCLPYLKDILGENLLERNDISMYQLINGFNNLNVQELFKWRNKNEPLPSFTSEHLIKKYGHKEKLTYKYYLKELRPSMAAYILQKQRSKISNSISSKIKSESAFYAHIYGLKNINDNKIISTCITFIEYIGIDSECLRFHATAANYIKTKLDLSINDLLESITYHNSPKDLAIITNYLEDSFKNECITSMSNVSEFISALKSWDFIVQFSCIHNTKFPSLFLKYLAKNNYWFEFVLVGHIFGYSLEQIFDIAELFKNKNIREHLLISLNNSHLLAETYSRVNLPLIKLPDTRQLNSSRMSRKNGQSSPIVKTNPNDTEELPNVFKYFPLNQINSSYNKDLWLTILKCHQSQDPPGALLKSSRDCKSSIPIVLAACYEPSATAAYCYSWLVISVNDEDLIIDYTNCLNDQIWSAKKVSDLFRRIISLGYMDTLSRGFQIFMPDNPLSIFFDFLVKCIKHADFKSSVDTLNNFLSTCSTFKSNKMIDWTDADTSYLNNEYWIATVATECILSALGRCSRSIQIQTKVLRILVENNFNSSLNIDGIEFKMLWEIVISLETTNVKIDFTAIKLIDNCSNITQEFKRCIQLLIDNKDFTTALELSKISNLPGSKIIIDQYRCAFKAHLNKINCSKSIISGEKCDLNFWKKCALDIKKYNVNFEDAAGFFIEHAEKVNSHKERYEILQLAHSTLKPISTDQQTIDTIEMAMWKSCILAGPEAIEINDERRFFNKLKTELLSGVSNLRVNCKLNDSSEEKAIDELINKFIDIEDLETALRISAIFNYKHNDLKILMLCLSIAEGEISPYELNSQHKVLLKELSPIKPQKYSLFRPRGLKRQPEGSTNLLASYDQCDDDVTDIPTSQITTDCIELLEKLVKNLLHGTNVGNKILLLYKLSVSLKRNYQNLLVSKDPIEILYDVTGINCPNKFDLIKDVITFYRIKDFEVAKFLAGEIILHITRQVEDGYELSASMWGYPLEVHAHLITDLCSDPSTLGWELIKSVNIRLGHSHGGKRDIVTIKIIIELLIRAHNYFTAACHMEGIAYVLRKCQNVANTLQHLKLWSLLVRLLTGIGRFTEMNYIFQILKENDQFEFLLGKGLDKIAGLKTATMEFCKKQCPDNKELFNLVANHFQLYTEVAIVWENKAKAVIRELLQDIRKENIRLMNNLQAAIKLTRNDKTEKKLQSAITYYTDATEHYLQDSKLNTANKCSHQAQLVALQLSLLNGVGVNHQVTCLLNLSNEEINKALCQTLTFPQTLILVQAYNHNADWPSIIYHHIIINGEIKFLKDFLIYKRLTNGIVQDCVCKYRMEKNLTKQMTQNMQSLIGELNDVECKYVMASQLGFKNMIEAMLSNLTIGSYLKDTVWKQGFNPQEFIGENFRS